MKKLLALFLLYLPGCNNSNRNNDVLPGFIDTMPMNKFYPPKFEDTIIGYKPFRSKKELLGIWATNQKEILTVEINANSIHYIEHAESYRYILKKDSIFITYRDFVRAAKVYFIKDTLIMESVDGKFNYYKLKE